MVYTPKTAQGLVRNTFVGTDYSDYAKYKLTDEEHEAYYKLVNKFGKYKADRLLVRSSLWQDLGYIPNPIAKQVHNAIDPGGAAITLVMAGRQSGKTYVAAREVEKQMAFRPPKHMGSNDVVIVAPRIELTNNIFKHVWSSIVEKQILGAAPVTAQKEKKKIIMPWGAELTCRTMSDAVGLRGLTGALLVVDEAAFMQDKSHMTDGYGLILAYLQPLILIQGQALLITTPDGMNWFTQAHMKAKQQNDPYNRAFHWTSYDNPFRKKGYLEKIEREARAWGMYDLFRQEYLADPTAKQSAVYPKFQPYTPDGEYWHADDFEVLQGKPVYGAIDWGYNEPMALSYFQNESVFDEDGKEHTKHYGLATYEYRELSIDEIIGVLREKEQELISKGAAPVEIYYCDPSRPDIIKSLTEKGINVWINYSQKEVDTVNTRNAGITIVQSHFSKIVNGKPIFVFHYRDFEKGIKHLQAYHYKMNNKGEDVATRLNAHIPDTVRYYLKAFSLLDYTVPQWLKRR